MNLIRLAIERPIAVIAAVLMVVMFGLVALQSIPIQLSPDVNRPVITVTTIWPGAAPAEVEREIVNRQEEVMTGLEGLDNITSRAELGRASMTLEFRKSRTSRGCIPARPIRLMPSGRSRARCTGARHTCIPGYHSMPVCSATQRGTRQPTASRAAKRSSQRPDSP